MIALISAAIAPGLALLSYFYLKDQYDSEPVRVVFRAFILGVAVTFPVMFIQYVIEVEIDFSNMIFQSLLTYGLLEEFFKWFILYFFIFHLVEFDEPYDGIVYGAAVSLGFATLENVLYLAAYGLETAVGRALLPVSSHALFGVVMGYYIGKAKFNQKRYLFVFISLILPIILHSIYDFILMSSRHWIYYMVPFMLFLWWLGLWKVKKAHILTDAHHNTNHI
ncbi:glutamic-type intramembrane protease PrsW [Jeotgalibacillus terrae]|uniref:Protease PrsW n=1 Tax=Jeotgalibacillus terrae TaxID=587735 RepID=A0ABW5ZJ75_9BACL|nr:glutamic-type intramembrane protease PrsW [Jeotgalibacillus terrae]MBM7577455.1 RsiW-degrading membrane proteinase PrsW (M82 family) [Jeotgalibacillus terrae]